MDPCDPWGAALPLCGAPTHSGWFGNGWAGRANVSSCRKSRLRKPQNRREATESNNICSNIFDHSCSLCRNGSWLPETHQTSCSRLSQWILRWAFFHHAVNSALHFQSRQCFSAEELKSFRAFPLFCSFMMTDCVSLLAWRQCYFSRLRACLGETKGYFGLKTSQLHFHRSLRRVHSSSVISQTTEASSASLNNFTDSSWDAKSVEWENTTGGEEAALSSSYVQ